MGGGLIKRKRSEGFSRSSVPEATHTGGLELVLIL